MVQRSIAWVLIASMIMGCQTGTQERILMRFDPAKVQAIKAPYNGEYRLYRGSMPADQPLLVRTLSRGDLVGFSQEPQGRAFAIIRSERTALNDLPASSLAPAQGFVWTMRPDSGQIDAGKTALLVLGVAAVVGVGVGIAVGVHAAQNPWWHPL